ncbi:hypothetical protein RCL_jg25059.t1 [Rhizophagus clarus]|uniref:Uncharacterized protein n=1 Tax=Rhizophagus clarus TaxID=94130 RepID=A0A8H3QTQ7_9GLOM|nr:hypothetical protein RCL_jg25059.t1 [Rhizophagus clarus]
MVANLGNGVAQYNLNLMYENAYDSDGIAEDLNKAINWDGKSSVITIHNQFLPVLFQFSFSPRPDCYKITIIFCDSVLSVSFVISIVLAESCDFKSETELN